MSMLLMVKAMTLKIGSPARKLVLIKLADNANDDGKCWPSYQNIADHCEMSKRSVMSHIKKLSEAGFLRIEHRFGDDGKNRSNFYYLTLDPSENISPPSENISPPPSENISLRTSHSIEPVNESKHIVQNAFDLFWSGYHKKHGKKPAEKAFKAAIKREKISDAMEFAQMLVDNCQLRFRAGEFGFDRLMASTYLNNNRWEDEIKINNDDVRHGAQNENDSRYSGHSAAVQRFLRSKGGQSI